MSTRSSRPVPTLPFTQASVDREVSSYSIGVSRGIEGELTSRGVAMKKLMYMVIEHFRNGDAAPVYARFRERGRLTPDGLTYVASWVDSTLRCCYQVMETADPTLLEQWMDGWRDLVDFEVHPVIGSAEAAARVLSAD